MNYLNESKQSIVNLGFPLIIATLMVEKFGNKASVFARWYKEYSAFKLDDPNWWSNFSHGFQKPSVVQFVKLYDATKLYAEKKTTLDEYNSVRDRLGFADVDTTEYPDVILQGLKEFISEEFFRETFFNRNLVKDFMKGKVKNLAPYSKLPFRQANEKYEEMSVFSGRQPIKSYDNGWKWIDVGAKCDLVGQKMKNCGSTGVMSFDTDRTMLGLFDQNNNPHVVATYSPNEKRISGIEGQASTAPKNEYTDYVIDLAKTLGVNIDTNSIKSMMLKLKVLLSPMWIKQIEGKSLYNEFYEFQLANGVTYYSNGFEATEKTQTDNLVLTPPKDTLFNKLVFVFGHHNRFTIEDIDPNFQFIKIDSLANNTMTEGLKRFVRESARKAILEIKARR